MSQTANQHESTSNEEGGSRSGSPDSYPFSLCCIHCDDGMHITSEDEAIRLGWTDIEFDEGGLGHNFTGLCPPCRAVDEGVAEVQDGGEIEPYQYASMHPMGIAVPKRGDG